MDEQDYNFLLPVRAENFQPLLNLGVAFGRAVRSYACRPYAHWPVSASITNAFV